MDILKRMKVKDIMVKGVTVFVEDGFVQAHAKFITHGVTHLCVVDGLERVVGIISQKYLYRTQSPRKILEGQQLYGTNIVLDGDSYYDKDAVGGFQIKNIMLKDPVLFSPDDTVDRAIQLMAKKRIGCIPVVDNNQKLRGVIMQQEIVSLVSQLLEGK